MKTAWFIDDDADMVRAIRMLLESLNYRVITFTNAREAAKTLLDGGQPDIMLIDIIMPQVSGIDLLTFIRERKEWNHIPILMLSAEISETQVDNATALGADGYVFKPVTLDELEIVISMAVEKRKQAISKQEE